VAGTLPAKDALRALPRAALRRRRHVNSLRQARRRRVQLGMAMDDDVYTRVVGDVLTHVGDIAVERPS
jgi:hypothetical protein